MAINRQRQSVSYGLSQPLVGTPPEPIVSTRAPSTTDKAEIGTTWINKSTNASWVLASIVANSATWTPTTVNAGATITTGDLTVVVGDIDVTAGDINIDEGDLLLTLGSITTEAVAGSITAEKGDIVANAGDIRADDGSLVCGTVVQVGGDDGIGFVGFTTFTNVVDDAVSTGAGKVLMKTANAGDSFGWMKFYDGSEVSHIPFWRNISP